ncbi:MAG TPA: hypothetical protein VF796_30930, partial [Humisphaera sp.]
MVAAFGGLLGALLTAAVLVRTDQGDVTADRATSAGAARVDPALVRLRGEAESLAVAGRYDESVAAYDRFLGSAGLDPATAAAARADRERVARLLAAGRSATAANRP